MIANEFLRILQNDCNPGIQYNTIQYNTIIILNFLKYLYLSFLIILRNIRFVLIYDYNLICFLSWVFLYTFIKYNFLVGHAYTHAPKILWLYYCNDIYKYI